ncbi:hypothetical protein CDD83_8815 [Cordyceps sp. RAO-2017]|nr:hypothetical protein CDD83_8815 [Cordyceps sp. RAO-2017]
MAALDRIVSFILRGAQLAFAVICVAILAHYLSQSPQSDDPAFARFIYTIVTAGISVLVSLVLLLPFSGTFTSWPTDIFISLMWWAAFAILVDLIGSSCGAIFYWGNIAPRGDQCGRFKAVIAFSFLSAIVWLAMAGIGLFWVRRHRQRRTSRV